MKKMFLSIVFMSFFLSSCAIAEELFVEEGKSYVLNFDEEIESINADDSVIKTEILNSIFNDKMQLIITPISKKAEKIEIKLKDKNLVYELFFKSKKNGENVFDLDSPPSVIKKQVDILEDIDLPPKMEDK